MKLHVICELQSFPKVRRLDKQSTHPTKRRAKIFYTKEKSRKPHWTGRISCRYFVRLWDNSLRKTRERRSVEITCQLWLRVLTTCDVRNGSIISNNDSNMILWIFLLIIIENSLRRDYKDLKNEVCNMEILFYADNEGKREKIEAVIHVYVV